MYIIYNTTNNLDKLRSKYLIMELDTLEFNDGVKTAYAVVDSEHIPLPDIPKIPELTELHANLIKNYRLQNWNYCIQAMEHLSGHFQGELDSFYEELTNRIDVLKESVIADDWTGNVMIIE